MKRIKHQQRERPKDCERSRGVCLEQEGSSWRDMRESEGQHPDGKKGKEEEQQEEEEEGREVSGQFPQEIPRKIATEEETMMTTRRSGRTRKEADGTFEERTIQMKKEKKEPMNLLMKDVPLAWRCTRAGDGDTETL
jgi:Mg-chelatase subunit ChlD